MSARPSPSPLRRPCRPYTADRRAPQCLSPPATGGRRGTPHGYGRGLRAARRCGTMPHPWRPRVHGRSGAASGAAGCMDFSGHGAARLMIALDGLLQVLPPPKRPLHNHGDWAAVEAAIGLRLPPDYKAFIAAYGRGARSTPAWKSRAHSVRSRTFAHGGSTGPRSTTTWPSTSRFPTPFTRSRAGCCRSGRWAT